MLATVISIVNSFGINGLVGVVVGSIITVAVPPVFRFVNNQFTWAKKETANTSSTVISDIEKKL